jgi:signal transduction histidine kinase/CheY-like chemotaxis protein
MPQSLAEQNPHPRGRSLISARWLRPVATRRLIRTLRHPVIRIGRAYVRIWVLLCAAVALIVVTSVLLSASLATLNNGAQWMARTERVRFQLAQILDSMSDLGSGVPAYRITHDPHRFDQAYAAAEVIPAQLAALQEVVSTDPIEHALVTRLIDLVHERQIEAEEQRARALRGDDAGVELEITSGAGRQIMEAARQDVAQMQQQEARLHDFHALKTQEARRLVTFGIGAEGALAIALLISIAIATVRHAERQRKLQEELAATLRRTAKTLREADQRKDVFLATLSHELRNPLAPIRVASRVLESRDLTPAELARSRHIISRQVHHMASLLDDLLDITRVTRGVLTLKKQQIELGSVLEAALETAQPAIRAKRHRITWDAGNAPILLEADPLRLTQIIANLLINAAKYTEPDGQITLRVLPFAEHVEIRVRDSGIGIEPSMLPKVFEMFSQVDAGARHSDGGLGIGLALVKGLIELHGGRVEARSEGLNSGSEFIVRLPLPAPAAPPAGLEAARAARLIEPVTAAPRTAETRSVLIADDNEDGAEIMAMLLKQSGHRVHVAHSGPEAFACASLHHPDVAVLDIGMPGMSGYEVAQHIRSEAWGKHMQLIAVTGWGQEGDKRRAEEAGFDHHLTKPIDPERLERLMGPGPAARVRALLKPA